MNDENDVLSHVVSSGWFVALLTGVWGLVLRILIGRYRAHVDLTERVDDRLNSIEADLNVIKAVLRERSRDGSRYTWPGDLS